MVVLDRPFRASPPLARMLVFVLLSFQGHCSTTESTACQADRPCECAEGDECFLRCSGDRCGASVHHVIRGGTVCDGAQCRSVCFDTNECSAACGSACNVQCHHTVACGARLGADAVFECESADRCGARLGPRGRAFCRSVSSCQVQCEGPCDLHCEGTGRCELECASGTPPLRCGEGHWACDSCQERGS